MDKLWLNLSASGIVKTRFIEIMSHSISSFPKRFYTFLSETVFLLSFLAAFSFVALAFFSRINSLSNLAEYLPENTQAFFVVNTQKYIASSISDMPNFYWQDFFDQDPLTLKWFKRDIALAWLNNEIVGFIETRSISQADNFMESTLLEGEKFIKNGNISCYDEEFFKCFTYRGDFLVFGSGNALSSLESGLESESSYINVRSRLPYKGDFFAYINFKNMERNSMTLLSEYLPEVFPTFGISIKMKLGEWDAESFLAVDKSLLKGDALFRPNFTLQSKIASLIPQDSALKWSGVEAGSFILSLMDNLPDLDLPDNLEAIFKNYTSLLDGEQTLSWKSDGGFLWILEVDDPKSDLTLGLKDEIVSYFTSKDPNLRPEIKTYYDDEYYLLESKEGKIYFAAMQDIILLSQNKDDFFSILDSLRYSQDRSKMEEQVPLLSGGQQSLSLDMTILQKSPIMSTLFKREGSLTAGVKIFDDGFYFRSHFVF